MYKWYHVLVQDLDENVDENLKDLDENLAWLTQKTNDLKGIKGTLLPPTHFLEGRTPPPSITGGGGGFDYAVGEKCVKDDDKNLAYSDKSKENTWKKH